MNIAETARSLIGLPSVLYNGPDKGNTPEGFDCSGLVQCVLQESGFFLPVVSGMCIRYSEEFFDFLVCLCMMNSGDIFFL